MVCCYWNVTFKRWGSRARTTMLPFKVKGGSNRNSAIALSCCWYGPASLHKKLIACRRTYSDPL